MSKKLLFLISFVLVLSLASASFSDVVIGNWESTLESWSACGWSPPGNPTLTPGQPIGVTLGSGSLKASGQDIGPEPLYWFIQINSNTGLTGDNFIANEIFALDVTRVASDWTPGPNDNSSTIGVQIQNNGSPEIVRVDGLIPWDGNDSTQTLFVDYSACIPATAPSWIQITLNTGTGGYTAGGIYYLDNARLLRSAFATTPTPKNGATDVLSNAILKWKPGKYADEHDVYLGTDFNDVNDANTSDTTGIYRGRQDPNTYDPPGLLDIGQTYYWRIDEVNEAGPDPCLWKGNVWSFSIVSYYAWNPKPIDGDIYEALDVQPRWNAGVEADLHRMYFGTDYNDVNDVPVGDTSSPLYKGYSTDTTWGNEETEEALNTTYNETYYWRIDEVNDDIVWKGNVWRFTTVPPGGNVVIGDWEDSNDGWWLVDANSSSYSTTGATLNNKSFRLEMPGDWHIAMGVAPNEVDLKSNDTFSIDVTWVTSEWLGGGGWARIENLVINAGGIGWVELGAPDTDTSNPGNPGNWDPCSYGASDTRTLTWYYSDANVCDIPDGQWRQIFVITNHDLFFSTGIYYFDNARLTSSPKASNPTPANGATDVERNPTLSWRVGRYADTHDVYFGTDYAAVRDANDPNTLPGRGRQDSNSYDPCGLLELDQTYYWRIDEVYGINIWKGDVWSFRTADYIVVENFDSYTDTYAPEDVWKPNLNSGAYVYLEPTLAHKGKSMKYEYYDDSWHFSFSEADADVCDLPSGIGSDWTVEDMKALVLYFYGQAGNDANEQMYVKLYHADSNAKVLYDGDMNDIRDANWHEWNIPLAAFTGVDLNDVNRITIGFGDGVEGPGEGLGVVYFDDIRLHPRRCVLSKRSEDFTKVDYAPAGSTAGDCVINLREFGVMADYWLMTPPADPNVDLYVDGTIDFRDIAILADMWLEEQLWP